MINKYKHIVYILFVSFLTFGYAQSLQELQKLRAEYEKLQKGKGRLQIPETATETIDPVTGLPRQAQIMPYKPMEEVDELEEILSILLNNKKIKNKIIPPKEEINEIMETNEFIPYLNQILTYE